jgi:hypothetical protein
LHGSVIGIDVTISALQKEAGGFVTERSRNRLKHHTDIIR